MKFLYPNFLWGLLAVLIPVAIHLFNFRKTKTIHFSTIAFLKEIEVKASSFRRIRHLLVMVVRMLAIAMLVLAFAQPYRADENTHVQQRTSIGVYLDNSLSMQLTDGTASLIDKATGELDVLLNQFGNTASIHFTTNEFHPSDKSMRSVAAVQDRLTTVELSQAHRSLQEVYNKQVKELGEVATGGRSLFWFSDFQKSTIGNLTALEVDSTDQIHLVPIATVPPKNIYIDSVWLTTPFVREFQHNSLEVMVRNVGEEPVENHVIRFSVEGTQVSTASVNIPAKASARATLHFSLQGAGVKKAMISFDDYPVTFDNDFYFVLHTTPAVRILYLQDKLQATRVSDVFANDSLFHLTSTPIGLVDVGRLPEYDLIVWEANQRISPALEAGLEEFVNKGGSVLVVPIVESKLKEVWNTLGQTLQVRSESQRIGMEKPNRLLPFFQDVFDASKEEQTLVDLPDVIPTWRLPSQGKVLLSLRDGSPYLTENARGKGKVYLLAGTLSDEGGNFSNHAFYVPVMYKIAALSVQPKPLFYEFNGGLVTLSDIVSSNEPIRLVQNQKEIFPELRTWSGQQSFVLPTTSAQEYELLQTGYWSVYRGTQLLDVLAINSTKEESELTTYTPDEMRQLLKEHPNFKIFDEIGDNDLGKLLSEDYMGSNWWKYFLYAALIFFLIEIVLLRWQKNG